MATGHWPAFFRNIKMGTFNPEILGNDTSCDIYEEFYSEYNNGENPYVLVKRMLQEYSDSLTDDDEKNNILFGLSLAAWETNALSKDLYEKIKGIVNSGNDLEVWEKLGADKNLLNERKVVLNNFLEKISIPIEKKVRRKRQKTKVIEKTISITQSKDKRCTFSINDIYVNDKYIHSSGLIMWKEGGGSVLHYNQPDALIKVSWLNKNKVRVEYEKGIVFSQQITETRFYSDIIEIIYSEL